MGPGHGWRKAVARLTAAAAVLVAAAARPLPARDGAAAPPVVLLHGLNRTSGSMDDLAAALAATGRRVVNLDYPSSRYPVAELSRRLGTRLDACCAAALAGGIDFVTHSLGGILVRELHRQRPGLAIRRVVMLAPPNRGSEVADALHDSALYKLVTGPVGQELGTGADGIASRLGPVRFELGVIAGTSTVNPLWSWIVPGEDDGTVAVDRTRVAGTVDFIRLDADHTFIMHDPAVIEQAVHFIETGRFRR